MKRIKIIRDNKVTNQAELKNADADAWLAQEIANNSFGRPERWTPEKDCTPEELAKSLGTRQVDDMHGGFYLEHHLPADFTVVEEDMTAEIAAKDAAKAQRNQLRADLRGVRDGTGAMTAAQLTQALRALVKLQALEDEG